MPRPIVDQTGQTFGRLTVLALADEQVKGRHARWVARCACGELTIADSNHLRRGDTRSCGCLAREVGVRLRALHATHEATHSPEYLAWRNMINRCEQPLATGYENYGGRGIKVCEEWRSNFPAFLEHIGPRPSAAHSIDRINNEGDYEPGNVRWATRDIQNRNQRPRRRKLDGERLVREGWDEWWQAASQPRPVLQGL